MTTTSRMGLAHLTAAQAQKHVTVNAGFDRVDALWNLLVEDIALTAPPGGESEGQAWIVASPATGDWTGREDDLAVFLNGGYEFIVPFDGLTAWFSNNRYTYYSGAWNATPGLTNLTLDRDATTVTVESDTGTDAVLLAASVTLAGVMTAADKVKLDGAAYDIPCLSDFTPVSSGVIGRFTLPRAVNFAADFAGSAGSVETNPTDSFEIDVLDDGVSIGTVTISTGGAFTFATVDGSAKVVAAGSKLEFVAPAVADATIEGISLTLLGYV